MKNKLVLLLVPIVLLMVGSAQTSTTHVETFSNMLTDVRFQLNVHSTNSLPDSVLWNFTDRGLVFSSVDIGGNEATFLVTLGDGDPIYPLADSVSAILAINIFDSDSTMNHSVQLWNPEFYEKDFPLQELSSSAGADQVSLAYTVSADTIQFFPTPVQTNLAVVHALVEHSSANTGEAAGSYDSAFVVRLTPKVAEAAVFYACYLIEMAYHGDRAASFLQQYSNIRAEVKAEYEIRYGRYWKRN